MFPSPCVCRKELSNRRCLAVSVSFGQIPLLDYQVAVFRWRKHSQMNDCKRKYKDNHHLTCFHQSVNLFVRCRILLPRSKSSVSWLNCIFRRDSADIYPPCSSCLFISGLRYLPPNHTLLYEFNSFLKKKSFNIIIRLLITQTIFRSILMFVRNKMYM